jgi:hypothetical protein
VSDAILDTSVLIDLLRAFPPATDWFANLKHFEPLRSVDANKPY